MKVLIILEYYYPNVGGVETAFRELAERLVKLGNEIHILTCRLPETKDFEELNGVKIHRITVPSKGGRYLFNTFWSIRKALRLGKDCDIIHAGCEESAFPAWITAKFMNKRSVITIQEPFGEIWNKLPDMKQLTARFYQYAEKLLLLMHFDSYACISQSTKSRLQSINTLIKDEHVSVIYYGIDSQLFDRNKANGVKVKSILGIRDEFIYMSFGRPGVSKGIEYLIQAIPLISGNIPRSKLLLVLAKDPENRRKKIMSMITERNLNDRVIIIEPVPRNELPDYIAAADCIVIPSISEGFGFSAAEACSMDKPIVASNVASLPEVISGKYIFVEPQSPEAIANGVIKAARNETQHSPKKTFNWDDCARKYQELYQKLYER